MTRKTLTLSEAAMLAGLMKAPSKLAPNRNPEGATERAAQVIAAMAQEGHITEAMAKVALGPSGAGAPRQGRRLDQLRRRLCHGHARRYDRRHRPGHRRHDDDRRAPADGGGRRADARSSTRRARNSASRRARSSRSTPMARSARSSAGAIMRTASSTARSRRSASRARPSSLSSISPALEHGLTPESVREDGADQREGLAPGELQPRIFRPGHADQGAVAVAQYRGGAARPGGRAEDRGEDGASARHPLGFAAQRLDRARHLGGDAARTRRAPMRPSPMAASACSRMSSQE